MSLEDYLATLSEVSLDYTDSIDVDYSKIPLVDFGKYKTNGATMYYCIGYKLSLESDNIFREKTDLRDDLFFIKETESGFEIVDYDYYTTYSKKLNLLVFTISSLRTVALLMV